MSAIEDRAKITLIRSPDNGCVNLPVRSEVSVVPSRATGIVGHSLLLVRGRDAGYCRGYIRV